MRIVRWLLAAVLIAAPLTAATASPSPERLRLDVTGWVDHTTTVKAHTPVPDVGDGIGPGSAILITIPDAGTFICSANFIWAQGSKRYLGAAGHCFLPEDKATTHGPDKDYDARGVFTRVCISDCLTGGELTGLFGNFVPLGKVVYSRQTGPGGDLGNDFGLVEIPKNRFNLIRPNMPVWGGPTKAGTLSTGEIVCHYGNGVAFGEVFPTKGRAGIGLTSDYQLWAADTPSAPGDSGSAVATCVRDADGLHGVKAIGILTHIAPGRGGIVGTTVNRAIDMAAEAKLKITPVLPKK